LSIDIPGFGALHIAHLVLDFNGTLAIDGKVLPGVKARADTFGKARRSLAGVECELTILGPGSEDRAKAAYVRRLGAGRVACIGNGRDILVHDVRDALDLLLQPRWPVATLRS
jgi:soluble P-type ATPase